MQTELNTLQDDFKQLAALKDKIQKDEAALHLAIRNSVAGVGKQIAADTAALPVTPPATDGPTTSGN